MASRQSWKNERKSPSRYGNRLKTDILSYFQLWRLAILEPVGVQIRNVPHFKGLIVLYLDLRSSRAWQYIYPLPRPLEKGHFTPKTAKCPRTFVANCMSQATFLLFSFWEYILFIQWTRWQHLLLFTSHVNVWDWKLFLLETRWQHFAIQECMFQLH